MGAFNGFALRRYGAVDTASQPYGRGLVFARAATCVGRAYPQNGLKPLAGVSGGYRHCLVLATPTVL